MGITVQHPENDWVYCGIDSAEDIADCLSCTKAKCTNCKQWNTRSRGMPKQKSDLEILEAWRMAKSYSMMGRTLSVCRDTAMKYCRALRLPPLGGLTPAVREAVYMERVSRIG